MLQPLEITEESCWFPLISIDSEIIPSCLSGAVKSTRSVAHMATALSTLTSFGRARHRDGAGYELEDTYPQLLTQTASAHAR